MKLCPTCKVNPRYVPPKGRCVGYCKQCWSARASKWNKENKARCRANQIKRNFGMDRERYEQLLVAQSGLCAICRETCSLGRELAIDHNHATEQNRGLLCFRCNTGIGQLRESPAILQRAIEYLSEWNRAGTKSR